MSESPRTSLPLADITVVEMGSSVAGPYAARILADMGADVFKVDGLKHLGDSAFSFSS